MSNTTLWRVRVILIPPQPSQQPDTTSLKDGDLMSPATIKVLRTPCKGKDILSDFDQIWTFSPNFNESLQYQIPWKSVQWELSW
jgi:hypothetical protein